MNIIIYVINVEIIVKDVIKIDVINVIKDHF